LTIAGPEICGMNGGGAFEPLAFNQYLHSSSKEGGVAANTDSQVSRRQR